MAAENAFFSLRQVCKVFRTGGIETAALADISLDIEEGEFLSVMGPSGCGKSTLLNIVAMLDTPTSGRYTLGGVEVSGASEAQLADIRKGNIGFIFQNFSLIDDLSVYQNVELPLLCLKVPRLQRQTRVREVLDSPDSAAANWPSPH